MRIRNIVIMLLLIVWAFPVLARGGGHRSGSSSGPKSAYVHGYTRKDGTYVAPRMRSAPGTAIYSTPAPTPSTFTPTPEPYRGPSTDSTNLTPVYSTGSSSTRSVHTYSSSATHTTHRTRITRTHTYRPRKYTTTRHWRAA